MATITTDRDIAALPKSCITDDMFTFGTVDVFEAFNAAKKYSIGDLITREDPVTHDIYKYVFTSPYNGDGTWETASTIVTSTDRSPRSVKADISNLADDAENACKRLVAPSEFSESKAYAVGDEVSYGGAFYVLTAAHEPGPWAGTDAVTSTFGYSLNDLARRVSYSMRVSGFEPTFDPSGILVSASSTDGLDVVRKRTGADGMCTMLFDRTKSYRVESERIDGWSCASNSGRSFYLSDSILNDTDAEPGNFVSSWFYHADERVKYDGRYWSFTAAGSGAWNPSRVKEYFPFRRIVDFVYRRCHEDDVTIKVKMQYQGGAPISGQPILAFAGDMSRWYAASGDANGEISFGFPKNLDFKVFCPSANWDYEFKKLDISAVSDKNKTIYATYPTGVYYVVSGTPASEADGTAWHEYPIESYPLDDLNDPDQSYSVTYTDKSVSPNVTRTTRHPKNHPCAFVHIATKELVSRKFDHSSMTLCASSTNPIRITASNQVFPWKDTPYDASYYIRTVDLTEERSTDVTTGRQWCSQNLLHQHVTTDRSFSVLSSYDGPLMTSWIKYDSDNTLETTGATPTAVAASSQAANYALSHTAQLGSRTLSGFIGTYMQMNPLFKLSPAIYEALSSFGYYANYKTGTYWWSATQNGNFKWGWSYCGDGSHYVGNAGWGPDPMHDSFSTLDFFT